MGRIADAVPSSASSSASPSANPVGPNGRGHMTKAHRDLAAPEPWTRSLERSRRRRELLPKARRENSRKKHVSAVLATAVVAGPTVPVAAAQVSGDLRAQVAAESPANRAIEVREGGLPLQVGSHGDLVAHVQQALHITADGVFGPQTDLAVRSYQQAAGLEVDGIVGLATWGALFESHTASGASMGGSNVPPQVKQTVEQRLEQAGQDLSAQGQVQGVGEAGAGVGTPDSGTTTSSEGTVTTPTPVSGNACGSSTISSPVHGTVTSPFGPRSGRNHDGMDIAAPGGTPVRAAACGTVSLAGQQSGYGNIVCITHTSQFSTCYAHLSRFGTSNGASVQQGQVIGYVGCTGHCTGPHLHFETRVGGTPRNPTTYLGGASIPGASANASQTASVAGASTAGTKTSSTTQATTATTPTGETTTSTGTEATVTGYGTVPAATETAEQPGTTATTTTAPAEATVATDPAVAAPAETSVTTDPAATVAAPAEPTVAAETAAAAPAPATTPVADASATGATTSTTV